MTHDELKEALLNWRPVVHASPSIGDIEYKRVSAIIYRVNDKNKIVITAELAAASGNSVSIVSPEYVKYKECKP